MHFIEHFAVAGVLFVLIDAGWLKYIKKLFEKELGDWILDKPDFKAAAVFYILYIVGVIVFAVDPALRHESFGYALGHGALLGLVMYATYELTNKSTLKKWSWRIVLPDMAWGTFLTAAVSVITFIIFR